jgi:betaine-aldehyde dehydrogenase
MNLGQTCRAHTRLLVPKTRMNEAVAIAKKAADAFTVGDPLGSKSRLGPLVSGVERERVQRGVKAPRGFAPGSGM